MSSEKFLHFQVIFCMLFLLRPFAAIPVLRLFFSDDSIQANRLRHAYSITMCFPTGCIKTLNQKMAHFGITAFSSFSDAFQKIFPAIGKECAHDDHELLVFCIICTAPFSFQSRHYEWFIFILGLSIKRPLSFKDNLYFPYYFQQFLFHFSEPF